MLCTVYCNALHFTTHAYMFATTCTHAMKHLRDLRSMYGYVYISGTITKWWMRACGSPLASHAPTRDGSITLPTQRKHTTQPNKMPLPHTWTTQQRWGCTHDTLHRVQIYENRWLGYTQQIYHHALHWTQHLDLQDHTERTKYDMYSTETSHLNRQLYLLRKRPRKIWDPSLWQILLLPA